jgi:hypothetical protein
LDSRHRPFTKALTSAALDVSFASGGKNAKLCVELLAAHRPSWCVTANGVYVIDSKRDGGRVE